MVLPVLKTALCLATATLAVTLLGAATPLVTASIAPLSPSAYNAETQPVTKTITAHTASYYQAAPVPDQDVDEPADTTKPSASVGPKMLSQKSVFQGDGYYYASDEQTTLDNRRAGVPGLGLSVPVK
jgi:hypothetical protein